MDALEQVNVLFKSSMGFPSTLETTPWYNETTVKYNNSVNGENIFLDTIPTSPTGWTTVSNTNAKINSTDLATNGYVKDDSTGTIRHFHRLILSAVPSSNNNSYYLLDTSGDNILADGLQFNTKWSGSGDKPYPYVLTNESFIDDEPDAPETLLQNASGGNWMYDIKNGIVFFPDYSSSLCNSDTNQPVFSFYKYIGRKGIDKLIKFGTSNPSNPVENQVYIDTTAKLLKRYNGSSWDSIGGGSTLTFNPPSSNNDNPSKSSQIKTALDLKANLASPSFTGELYVYNSSGVEKIALKSSGESHLSGGNLSITGVHNVLMLKAPSRTCVFYYKGTALKWITGMNSTTNEKFHITSNDGNDDLILNSTGGNVGINTSSPNYLGSSEPTPNSSTFPNLSKVGSGKTAPIKLDVRGSLELSDANPASPDGSASIPNIYFPASNHQEGNCGLIWRNYHTYGREVRGAILFEATKSGYGYSSGGFGFYTSHYQSGYGSSNVVPTCRMTIRGNGDVGVGTENPDYFFHVAGAIAGVSYTTTSDNRLKHNETDIENALDLINKLEVKKYFKSEKIYEKDHHYKLDSEGKPITDDKYIVECGLIAQQVKDIPELSYCVEGEEEQKEIIVRDAILRKAKKTPLHLKYQNLFCYNIKATQELDRQQQADKAKIASLETKVASLESELAAIKAHLGL